MLGKLDRFSRFALVIPCSACLLMPCGSAAWGQWVQTHKLTAADPDDADSMGQSVAISGNTIVVGCAHSDDHANKSGSAYVFDAVTGQQIHKLTANDAAEMDLFGLSVSVSGNTIVVSAYQDDDGYTDAGSAYMFDATTGEQLANKLTADPYTSSMYFGWSTSVSDCFVVVGTPADEQAGHDAGAAYVFSATEGPLLHRLIVDDLEEDDGFGRSVSISEGVIVVGCRADDDMGTNTGSVYVFDAVSGQQLRKLLADDLDPYDRMGHAVSIDGNIVVASAPYDCDAADDAGSVYVFDAITGQQLHKLTAADAEEGDHFGYSVSVSGNLVVVGSPQDDNIGSAYVFDATTGQQICKLRSDDAEDDHITGFSVAISGNTVVVGNPHDDAGGYNSGCAYVFQNLPPCPADLNTDDFVDIDDMFTILATWGPCDDCPEDINEDGVVDIDDLFEVLAQWGPCS